MKFKFSTTLSVILAFSCSNITLASNTRIYNYQLLSNAEAVGDITLKVFTHNDGSYVIADSTLIEITSMWGDVSVRSTQIETFSPNGNLLKSDVKSFDGENAYWRRAELSEDELWVSYTQVQNLKEKEEEEFIGGALTLASNLVPSLGEVLDEAASRSKTQFIAGLKKIIKM